MKIIIPFFLLMCLVLTSSCSKDQDVIDDVTGTWRIESIVLSPRNGTADSTIQNAGTLLSIPSCTTDKNKVGGCDGGKFNINGKELLLSAQYEFGGKTDFINFNLSGGDVQVAGQEAQLVSGRNTISEISANSMVLIQENDFPTYYKNYDYNKRIIRLSK